LIEQPYQHIGDDELADEWVTAFKELAKDYKSNSALAVVDAIADEMRARGIVRPVQRVAEELSQIASQMRAAYSNPPPMQRIRLELDNELSTFAATHNENLRKNSEN
jgi:hypothetical protein